VVLPVEVDEPVPFPLSPSSPPKSSSYSKDSISVSVLAVDFVVDFESDFFADSDVVPLLSVLSDSEPSALPFDADDELPPSERDFSDEPFSSEVFSPEPLCEAVLSAFSLSDEPFSEPLSVRLSDFSSDCPCEAVVVSEESPAEFLTEELSAEGEAVSLSSVAELSPPLQEQSPNAITRLNAKTLNFFIILSSLSLRQTCRNF
jgi:hypothetical protein